MLENPKSTLLWEQHPDCDAQVGHLDLSYISGAWHSFHKNGKPFMKVYSLGHDWRHTCPQELGRCKPFGRRYKKNFFVHILNRWRLINLI